MENKVLSTSCIFMVSMLAILLMGTISYASSKRYVSNEGIGIEVTSPNASGGKIGVKKIINDPSVSVSGGALWTTWDTYTITFRANYEHGKKTHRSSATNANAQCVRSAWVSRGYTAKSPWLAQTIYYNRVWGATK